MTGHVISKCSKSCVAFLQYLHVELLVVIVWGCHCEELSLCGVVIVCCRILIIKLVFVFNVKGKAHDDNFQSQYKSKQMTIQAPSLLSKERSS